MILSLLSRVTAVCFSVKSFLPENIRKEYNDFVFITLSMPSVRIE